jgi:DNA polymerase-3 subunit alpha
MELVATVMNITFGEADLYRRMLEKPSKFVEEVAQWKEEFVKKGIENGFGEKLSVYLIDFILNSAGYSFNKSHAVCYSIIGYWTAYMKANYPLVFYTTILNGNLEEADVFMGEARKAGIQISVGLIMGPTKSSPGPIDIKPEFRYIPFTFNQGVHNGMA